MMLKIDTQTYKVYKKTPDTNEPKYGPQTIASTNPDGGLNGIPLAALRMRSYQGNDWVPALPGVCASAWKPKRTPDKFYLLHCVRKAIQEKTAFS